MKQGYIKAALAVAVIAGLMSGDMPEPGKARHDVSACTRDGELATLSYAVLISPLSYRYGGRMNDQVRQGVFLRELEGTLVGPLKTDWTRIMTPYSASDLREGRAAPQRAFLKAVHGYADGYGLDKINAPVVDVMLTGARLAPDTSCAKPA